MKIDEELTREAKERFPGEFRILICYAWELAASPYDTPHGNCKMTPKELISCNREVLSICQRIIEDCTIDEIRYNAIDLLSMTYMELRDMENAVKVAEKLPDYSYTRNMAYDYDTEEHIKFHQENIQSLTLDLWLWIRSAVLGQKQPEKKIVLCRKGIALYALMYEDGDYGYSHTIIAQIYKQLAATYLEIGDNDSALDAVEQYIRHSLAFMQLPSGFCHTSMLFDRLIFCRAVYMTRSAIPNDFKKYRIDFITADFYIPLLSSKKTGFSRSLSFFSFLY